MLYHCQESQAAHRPACRRRGQTIASPHIELLLSGWSRCCGCDFGCERGRGGVGRRDDRRGVGRERAAPELQRGLDLGGVVLTGKRILWGQGEVHLKCALDKLRSRFGLEVQHHPPISNKVERTPVTTPAPVYERVTSVPEPATPAAKGKYLAETVSHCMQCHTPRDGLAQDLSRIGAGGAPVAAYSRAMRAVRGET